jgi:hypothetical protein
MQVFKYKGFVPNPMGSHIFRLNNKNIVGNWVVGVYVQHSKTMLSPIGNTIKPEDNIEHLLFADGMSDWGLPIPIESYPVLPESLCLVTPYKTHNNKGILVNDVVTIQYKEQSKEYMGTGLVVYRNNRYFVDCGKMIDANDVVFLSVVGNIVVSPDLTYTRELHLNSIMGTIIAADWCDRPYKTHRIKIRDYEGNHWTFGNLDLSDKTKSMVWSEHLQRMFGVSILSNTLCGQSVYVQFENNEPVVLYTVSNGISILDIRNVFDELE